MDFARIKGERRQKNRRFGVTDKLAKEPKFKLHPLFIAVGVICSLTGDLFLFLMSCLVALQHECAHAFAAAKLGYKLNKIVLMPFGAVIDLDVRFLPLKDEISVALAGPICNLVTAAFFAAVWWFAPTMYAFTDTACFASLSVALVNLLPAYPLDGGRVFRCLLTRYFLKKQPKESVAERKAMRICRIISWAISAGLFTVFFVMLSKGVMQITLLAFGCFVLLGAFGNRDKSAVYAKMDFSCQESMKAGVEIKKVAILESCYIKDAFKYLSKNCYLVLDVYDANERFLFSLTQNELSKLFLEAPSPYTAIAELKKEELS